MKCNCLILDRLGNVIGYYQDSNNTVNNFQDEIAEMALQKLNTDLQENKFVKNDNN